MRTKKITFFSPSDNEEKKQQPVAEEQSATCSIAKTGRLTFPAKAITTLGIDPSSAQFRVGRDEKKRKLKALYLIPTDSDGADTFSLTKTGQGYTINLKGIFQKLGLDYANQLYQFTVNPFSYEAGVTGYELSLEEPAERGAKQPSARGRKPRKNKAESEA